MDGLKRDVIHSIVDHHRIYLLCHCDAKDESDRDILIFLFSRLEYKYELNKYSYYYRKECDKFRIYILPTLYMNLHYENDKETLLIDFPLFNPEK